MRKIGGNTRSVDDIIESQFGYQGAGLQEEGQRLLKELLVLFNFQVLAQEFIPDRYHRQHRGQLLSNQRSVTWPT